MTPNTHPDAIEHFGGRRHPPDDACVRVVSQEHGALVRQLAVLQARLGDQLAWHASRLCLLEAENLRLRAELVRTRTAVLWGLHVAAVTTPPRRCAAIRSPVLVERRWAAAQAVICQTGCEGHGHPWLDEQGQCRRTGELCQSQEMEASDPRGPETRG